VNAPEDSVESLRGKRHPSGPAPRGNIARRSSLRAADFLKRWAKGLTPTCPHPTSRRVITGTILCRAFPRRANVGHKLYTVAWSRMLRPTRKCGPCGFRWPRHGRSSLKRWSGYSHTKGRVMRTARDQDDPKSRLEAPPMQCPRCETRPLADLYVRRDHSPVPSPSLVRSEKQRAPKCRVQAFTSRTNHLNCCRNNTVNSHHLEYFGASPAGSGGMPVG